ncbi:dihydroxyacetone kinase subunit L [Mycolicibacterium litorale]|nr:dihydroxyacetone kinase subunit L [Mycolicibacterium litorale]
MTVDDFARWLRTFATAVHDNAALLTELDSAIGDADHGSNMDRGMAAVVALLDQTPFERPDELCKKTGMTLVSTVGGASGPLYGTFFLRLGAALGVDVVDAPAFGAALRAGVQGVQARGKAEIDDKTMYDALAAASAAYDGAAETGFRAALAAAAAAAAAERDRITPLVARKGRASYLGERSADHQDPGATSATLLLESATAMLP